MDLLFHSNLFVSMNKTRLALINNSPILTPYLRQHSNKQLAELASSNRNPLITEASKLFTYLARLQHKTKLDAPKIQKNLIDAIHDFEERLHFLDYDAETIFACQYALHLCAENVFDLPVPKDVSKSFITKKTAANVKFITTLKQLSLHPDLFLDQLEFVYICLSLGNLTTQDNNIWQPIINNLYQIIRHQRGEIEKQLSLPLNQSNREPAVVTKESPFFLSAFRIILTTFLILFSMHWGVDYLLQLSAKPLSDILTTSQK